MITLKIGDNIFTVFGLFSYLSYISFSFIFAGFIENYIPVVPAITIPLCANIFAENNLDHYVRFNFRSIRPRFYSFGALYGLMIYAICLKCYDGIPLHVGLNVISKTLCISCGIGRIGCHFYGCCWGKQLYNKETYAITYRDADTLILRLCPHLAGKQLFPLQWLEANLCIISGFLLYSLNIIYDYNVAIPNIVIYCVIRCTFNKYRHDCTKGTSIIDFIILPLLCCIYLYFNPSNIIYLGLSKQIDNFLKNNSLYYGIVLAFIYGFHYKKLGYWYNISSPKTIK
jgi:hypothetical protein